MMCETFSRYHHSHCSKPLSRSSAVAEMRALEHRAQQDPRWMVSHESSTRFLETTHPVLQLPNSP